MTFFFNFKQELKTSILRNLLHNINEFNLFALQSAVTSPEAPVSYTT